MEVRSNTEKCGNDAMSTAAAATAPIDQSIDSKTTIALLDQSKTTANDDTMALTRDESK